MTKSFHARVAAFGRPAGFADAVVPSTGIHDQEDRFTGPNGWLLPGWASVKGESTGGN